MKNADKIREIVRVFREHHTIKQPEPVKRNTTAALFYEAQFTYGSGARWTLRKADRS